MTKQQIAAAGAAAILAAGGAAALLGGGPAPHAAPAQVYASPQPGEEDEIPSRPIRVVYPDGSPVYALPDAGSSDIGGRAADRDGVSRLP
jgi:hypothetical protein